MFLKFRNQFEIVISYQIDKAITILEFEVLLLNKITTLFIIIRAMLYIKKKFLTKQSRN